RLEEWVDDPGSLTDVLARMLEAEPTVGWAIDRLALSYNAAGRWDDLLALYDRAIAATEDKTRRVELLGDAAQVAKDFANRSDRAIDYLEQLLAFKPRDARLIASLERLYERHAR